MPWRRTVSVWDEIGAHAYLRILETRPSDGLGDYTWPTVVEELEAPPRGYHRVLRMRFFWSNDEFPKERILREYSLTDKKAALG